LLLLLLFSGDTVCGKGNNAEDAVAPIDSHRRHVVSVDNIQYNDCDANDDDNDNDNNTNTNN
jgi:hypothetical protein